MNMMKFKIPVLTGLYLFILLPGAQASTWSFEDDYTGSGAPPSYSQNGGDVVSASGDAAINNFDIDGMAVTIGEDGEAEVIIYTDYEPNIVGLGTDYGDLFISAQPYSGEDDYDPDNPDWNYVFETETGNIYATEDGEFVSTNDEADLNGWSGGYREDQTVGFEPDEDAEPVGTGSFDDSQDGMLIYTFDLEDLDLTEEEGYELAFGWSMTCGNDIIRVGGIEVPPAPVPEPGTLALLGFGLLGLGHISRKRP